MVVWYCFRAAIRSPLDATKQVSNWGQYKDP